MFSSDTHYWRQALTNNTWTMEPTLAPSIEVRERVCKMSLKEIEDMVMEELGPPVRQTSSETIDRWISEGKLLER